LELGGLGVDEGGVVEGVSEDGDALRAREEVDGESAGCGTFAEGLELSFHPSEGVGEKDGGFFGDWARVLVEFGAEGADGAAAAGEFITIFDFGLDEGAKAVFGIAGLVELLEQLAEAGDADIQDGAVQFVFRLEVVVDVAERDASFFSDVGEGGLGEAVAVGGFFGGLQEAGALVCFRLEHCGVL